MNRRRGALFAAVALAAGAVVWAVLPPRPAALRPPLTPVVPGETNVVVMIGCTFREDQVGAYGGPRGATPFLDSFAREGTRFADTIAQAPWTKAGTTSIITGDYAISLGVNHPGIGPDDQRIPDAATTLAERFADRGYTTVGGTANPNANAVFGFDQGFDSYYEATGLWRKSEVKVPGEAVVDEVLSRLPAAGPFYAQVLLVDAHTPYAPGLAWWRWWPFSPTTAVAQYRSQLQILDAAFEHLAAGLAARGHDERDTVFVVIGDHGEGLYTPEHHGKAHGFYLYPTAVHVPWLMRGPGIARGHVIEGLSQQIDLAPTLAGLLDLSATDGPGHDLSALVDGSSAETGETRAFVDTWFRSANRAAVYTPDRMCQRDFDPIASVHREIRAKRRDRVAPPFPTACFDWRTDPDATVPVRDDALDRELQDWRAGRETDRAAFIAAHGDTRAPIDDATREALRGLGYVE